MNTLKLSAAVAVDKGHVRANNEDNIYFNGKFLTADIRDDGFAYEENPVDNFIVYAVFDGMGGEAYGEEASLIAAETSAEFHSKCRHIDGMDVNTFVSSLVSAANAAICKKMAELNSGRMGATMALVAVFGGKARVFNVGDSRVYLMRDGVLQQVSVDDSYAQKLYRMGMITKEEANVHKDRNKLTQHLGIASAEFVIEPHVSEDIFLKEGDKILLCSDGLTDMVPDFAIQDILSENRPAKLIADELICEALKNGGKDNISVILLDAEWVPDPVKPKSYKAHIISVVMAIVLVVALTFGAWVFWGNNKPESKSENKSEASEEKIEVENTDAKIDVPLIIDYEKNFKDAKLTEGVADIPSYYLQKRVTDVYGTNSHERIENFSSDDETVVTIYSSGILFLKNNGSCNVSFTIDGHEYVVPVTVQGMPQ